MLIPPKAAPPRVKAVIAAANRIRTKPYIYGGGHAQMVGPRLRLLGLRQLRAARRRLPRKPASLGPDGELGHQRRRPLDHRLANAGHAYAEIAGYRWDTSGDVGANGPALALGPARQRRFRPPPPARLLDPRLTVRRPGQPAGANLPCFPDRLG